MGQSSHGVRRTILGVTLTFFIFVPLIGYFAWKEGNLIRQSWDREAQDLQILDEQARELQRIWMLGDIHDWLSENPSACKDIWGPKEQIPKLALRCNPGFMQCLFSGKLNGKSYFKILHPKNPEYVTNIEPYIWNKDPEHPNFVNVLGPSVDFRKQKILPGILVGLKIKNSNLPGRAIFLENTCQEVYLPTRFYPYGSSEKSTPIQTWDNFHRTLFVDRFLVSNAAVLHWQNKSQDKPSYWDYIGPATNLSLTEMESFCSDQGKRLLTAQLLDAHSFYPRELENPKSIPGILAKNYWEQRPGNKNTPTTATSCAKVFSQECWQQGQTVDLLTSSTWTEIYQVMGGPLEALDNWVNPEINLKLSSFYFPATSGNQKLANRGHWDGLSHDYSSLQMSAENAKDFNNIVSNFQIGFRCYREVVDAY